MRVDLDRMLQELGRSSGSSSLLLTDILGLDATIFLRCMAMLRWMFLAITIVVGIPALAANWYISTLYIQSQSEKPIKSKTDPDSDDDIDLLMFTAANASGNAMSAHVIFECLTTCLVILFGMPLSLGPGSRRLISYL